MIIFLYRTWIKLGNGENRPSDLFLLRKGMEFKLNVSRFEVTSAFTNIWPICDCKNEIQNSVYLECLHFCNLCYDCANEENFCMKCNLKRKVWKLIDLYNPQ